MFHRDTEPTVMLKYLSTIIQSINRMFTVCSSGIYGLKMDENLAESMFLIRGYYITTVKIN